MCETCGCGQPDEFSIRKPGVGNDPGNDHLHEHLHEHDGHWHSHDHDHSHEHAHTHGHDHPAGPIPLNIDVLGENNRLAMHNRGFFEGRKVLCLNLVSSPGSGKTTILEKTIRELLPERKICVIEGDQQTTRDADRIAATGASSIQINTGSGCHLDANMVHHALEKLEVDTGSILFIENVGNLVCPALFDLGEKKRVVVISVTEGDDKPLKYPYMFQSSHLCLINKTDLLPYVDFSMEKMMEDAGKINPSLEFIALSAKTGEGMKQWIDWVTGLL
jgi:hydrogenase nickel incorporation protein HypB